MSSRWSSPAGWREHYLGDLVDIYDGPHATPKKTASGPIFLGISCLVNGRLRLDGVAHLSEEDFIRWTRRVTPQPGDVVFSYETRLGEAAAIPEGLRCCLGRRMGLLRPKSPLIDRRFLLYAYLGPQFQRVIRDRTVHGSTVDRISLKEMGSFPLLLPPVDEQRRIASVLGALDAKIESNHRLAKTLDETAEALVRRWLAEHAAAPTVRLDEVVDLVLGGTPSRQNESFWTGGTVAWIASGKANEFRILTPSEWITEEAVANSATKPLPAGTTVVAITGATMGKVSRLEIDACANQSIVALVGNETYPDALLFYWLRASIPELLKRQTGAAQQHVNKGDVGALLIPRFDAEAVRKIDSVLRPLMDKVRGLLMEARTLESIRDELLPKVVSGEIRVPLDADGDEPTELAA